MTNYSGEETKGQKDFCIAGVLKGVFSPVHLTFMPIKQLELKH